MWWKIYFWFFVVLSVGTALDVVFHRIHEIDGFMILHLVLFYGALVGLFAYLFRKRVLTQTFWKYYFWVIVILDCSILLYTIFPNAPLLSYLSVFFYKVKTLYIARLVGAAIFTVPELPLFYSLYRLSQGKFYEPKTKEKKVVKKLEKPTRFGWGMLQMALWGYSSILILYVLIFSFVPSSGSDNTSDGTNVFYGVAMYAPLLIFWLWVVVRYKRYRWNWWRTTLVANALLYSGSIIFGVLVPQSGGESSGFDIVSVLILLILLVSLYVFGREQFLQSDKQ